MRSAPRPNRRKARPRSQREKGRCFCARQHVRSDLSVLLSALWGGLAASVLPVCAVCVFRSLLTHGFRLVLPICCFRDGAF